MELLFLCYEAVLETFQAEFGSIDELKLHQDGGCFRKEPLPTTGETMQDFIKKINIAEMGITGRNDILHEASKGPLFHMQTIPEIDLTEALLKFAKDTKWSPINTTIVSNFGMGFALPLPTHKNKIVQKARDFVQSIFDLGAGAGGDRRNATAAEIAYRMRREEIEGQPLFEPNEYLDEQQIKYLIHQFVKKIKESKKDPKASEPDPLPEPLPGSLPEVGYEEEQQIVDDHAVAEVDMMEQAAIVDNAVNHLENTDISDSNNHPYVKCGVAICDLAKSILLKKRRDLSPLQYLEDEAIKNIAITVGTRVFSQELCASQKTKEVKFKDVENAVIHFVKTNCQCTVHLQFHL